ncbi:acyltransferase [Acidovorax sp.]|uniref:acyltransferase family protein n=1 Tax=Acidovorax sp. TaxID=1872122 RepID=UPI00262ED729|nr:acyltransferase [Acidovorax sp.]
MQPSHQNNHFNLLRLAAALAVFVAHGDFLYRLHLPVPFAGHSLGSVAVYIFFFISGYLICQSWSREPDWFAFWIKRLMRIYPGLVVAVVFSVCIVGWSATVLTSADYWQAPGTWSHLANNAAGLATVQTLPGVFESNPFARAVNGSLWTIRYELAMYFLLAFLAWGGGGRRWVYPMAVCVLASLWGAARSGGWDAAIEAAGGGVADVFRWRDFCGFGVPFFMGSTMAAYAVRPQWWMGWVAGAMVVCAIYSSSVVAVQVAVWALVVFGTFHVAHARNPGQRSRARGQTDLSYGIYIYAFPIQQAATEFCLREGWPLSVCMLVSLGFILMLAALSWHCVERPCIQAAHRYLAARRQLRSMFAANS